MSFLDTILRALGLDDSGGDDSCVSCASTEIETLFEGVYRCTACGYEGGPGYAAYLAERRREKLASLDGPARREAAQKLLADAHLLLLGVKGTLGSARAAGMLDLLGPGSGPFGEVEQDKHSEFFSAVWDVLQAQKALEDAAELLDVTYPPNLRFREKVGFDATTEFMSDNLFQDMAFLEKARRSIGVVESMQAWCAEMRTE